jgi:hypothetical protein
MIENVVVIVLSILAVLLTVGLVVASLPAPYRVVWRRNPRLYKAAYSEWDAVEKANAWHSAHPGDVADVMTRKEHEALIATLPKPDNWYRA